MPQSNAAPPPRRTPPAQQLPPEVVEILGYSLQVGLGAGTVGLFVGAASGIVRSAAPVLFSLVTGAQWFALGSSYSASRKAVISAWGGDNKVSRSDTVKASAIAGASAGLVGGLIRGPRNILPAIAVFSILGATGQAVLNAMPASAQGGKSTWLDSKWSPVKPLTDDEYAKFIEDKILKIDVEMSMVDDRIAALKATKAQRLAEASKSESGSGS